MPTQTATAPDTSAEDGAVDTTPGYADRVATLAEKFHKNLVKAEKKKRPADRAKDKDLWSEARKAAAAEVRRQMVKETASRIARNAATTVYAEVKSAAHRNRKQLAPWALATPYALVGETTNLIAEYSHGASPIGISALCAATAAGASILAWRKKVAKRTPARFAPKVQAGMALACGWTAGMPLIHGPAEWGMWLAALASTAWLSLGWWREHDHPIPLPEDIATLNVDEDQDVAVGDAEALTADRQVPELVAGITAAWADRVRVATGAVPGSDLSYTGTTGNAACFAIQLAADGQITPSTIGSRRDRIALAIGVFPHQITFDPTDPTVVIMRITLAAQESTYTGPVVLCDGKQISSRWEITPGASVDIVFAPYLDGEGAAMYRVIDAGSVNSAFILGSIGSGKTLLAEQIAIALRFIGCELWYVDGQDGASSDMLKQHADWSIPLTAEDVESLYQAIEGVMDGRNLELRTQPELNNKYTYDPNRPPVITIMEEAQEVFRMTNSEGITYGILLGQQAQKIRKTGIAFLAISQDFDMTGTFGGSDMLRNCLLAGGNFFAMRFTSPARKGMLPAACPDLQQVPKHGFGYSPMGSRPTAMWRAVNIENSARTKHEWMEAFPPATLDVIAQRKAGVAYEHRLERAEESMESAKAELEFVRNSTAEEIEAARRKKNQKTAQPSAEGQAGGATVVRFPFTTAPAGQATPAQQPPAPAPPVESTQPESARLALTDTEQQVLDILTDTPHNPTSLGQHLGIRSQSAGQHLRSLAAKGWVSRMDDGRYTAQVTAEV